MQNTEAPKHHQRPAPIADPRRRSNHTASDAPEGWPVCHVQGCDGAQLPPVLDGAPGPCDFHDRVPDGAVGMAGFREFLARRLVSEAIASEPSLYVTVRAARKAGASDVQILQALGQDRG